MIQLSAVPNTSKSELGTAQVDNKNLDITKLLKL